MSALDFLVELGTEELPPKALAKLAEAFCAGIEKGLKDAGLAPAQATPRRVAGVLVEQLADPAAGPQHQPRRPPMQAAFDAHGEPTQAAWVSPASVAWIWPR